MEAIFLKLVNQSLSAGWLVLAILALRPVLRRAPRWSFCLLWGLLALRLLCPVSIESPLSLLPSAQPLPPEILYTAVPRINSGISALNSAVNPVLAEALAPAPAASANPTQIWSFVLARLWLAGMVLLLLYALVSYAHLRRRVATATLLRENIRETEGTDTPFVLGLLRPAIYLPYGVAKGDLPYVIAHERAHIRRGDHWWKALGFVLLSVYWFHPLLWAAYALLCRDIEGACDEKVIRELDGEGRRGYAAALLHCGVRRRTGAACPLAFGEVGVKARIKAVMTHRKPGTWLIVAALAACVAAAVCFLTDPVVRTEEIRVNNRIYTRQGEAVEALPDGSYELGVLKSVRHHTAAHPEEDFRGTNLDEKYAGNRLYQSGASADVIYLEDLSGCYLPFTAQTSSVAEWVDYTGTPSEMDWDGVQELQLPQFPGVTFRYTPYEVTADAGEGGEPAVLITGMPVWSVWFTDLTGDGLPELCATLSWGSGMIDTRVVIYDYAGGASYGLEDRGNYDYSLRYSPEEDRLYVDKRSYWEGELVSSGPLVYEDGCIQVLDGGRTGE